MMVFGLFAKKDVPASDCIAVTLRTRRPRAIVVILGWMGSSEKELQEYASLYQNLLCSTVCVTAPTMSLAMHDATTLGEIAVAALREASRLVRMGEWSEMGRGHVPIIIQVLSHGGAQLLEEIERRIREVVSPAALAIMNDDCSVVSLGGRPMMPSVSNANTRTPSLTFSNVSNVTEEHHEDVRQQKRWIPLLKSSLIQNTIPLFDRPNTCGQRPRRQHRKRRIPILKRFDMEKNKTVTTEQACNSDVEAYQRDLQLFASRLALGAIVFDSAPCFPSLQRELSTAEVCLKSDPVMRLAAQSAISSQQVLHGIMHHSLMGRYPSTTGGSVEVGRPEQFWRNFLDLALTKRHAFIYGAADNVCDAYKIKELIASHRKRGLSIIECPIGGTGHLEHNRRHHDLYMEFLCQVLDSVCPKKSGEENEEDGWLDAGAERVIEKIAKTPRPKNWDSKSMRNVVDIENENPTKICSKVASKPTAFLHVREMLNNGI